MAPRNPKYRLVIRTWLCFREGMQGCDWTNGNRNGPDVGPRL